MDSWGGGEASCGLGSVRPGLLSHPRYGLNQPLRLPPAWSFAEVSWSPSTGRGTEHGQGPHCASVPRTAASCLSSTWQSRLCSSSATTPAPAGGTAGTASCRTASGEGRGAVPKEAHCGGGGVCLCCCVFARVRMSASVFLCVCLCVCVCLYVCMCLCLRVCLSVCVGVFVSVCVCVPVCLRVSLCVSLCLQVTRGALWMLQDGLRSRSSASSHSGLGLGWACGRQETGLLRAARVQAAAAGSA